MLNFLFTKTPLFLLVQSFWRDEAFSYLLAKKPILEMFVLTARDFNPPFYYFILHFWIKFFGSSEIALRSLSLIFYWATIYLVFLVLTEILKIKTKKSLIYLLLFVFNPILIRYAFEVRMYAFLAFLATLSFYAFLRNKKILYILAVTAGVFTHYFMILIVAVQIIYRFTVRSVVLPLGMFFLWIIFVFSQKAVVFQSFWIEPTSFKDLLYLPAVLFTGYEKGFGLYFINKKGYILPLLLLSILLMVIFFLGYKKLKENQPKKMSLFFLLILWTFLPSLVIFFISFFKPLFLPRYLIFSTVGLLLLTVYSIEHLPAISRFVILSFLVLLFTVSFSKIKLNYAKKSDLRRIVKEIKTLSRKSDVLYVTNELDFHTAQYYFDENRVFIYGKTYEEIPNYVGKILIPKEKVVNKLPRYPTKAFILTSDSHYEIQAAF